MREWAARGLAIIGAVIGWTALALQFAITLHLFQSQGGTVLDALWRFFGYFTLISNMVMAAMLTLAVFRKSRPGMEFAVLTAMLLVGIVYTLLLRETWNPQGWQKLADIALHDITPVIMAAFWLLRPHRVLRFRHVLASLILPLAYCAYAMARGALDQWYAYPFLNVTDLGAMQAVLNCAGLGAAFLLMSIFLAGLDRILP
jgi:hypothetical protein